MRFHQYEIEPRMRIRKFPLDGILSYDGDNAYPNRVEVIINASGRATSCTNEYARFIRGEGFNNPLIGNLVVNRKGETLNKILRKVSHDVSRFRHGLSLHFNYDLLGRIIEINHVAFKHNRYEIEKGTDEIDLTGRIAFYPDWGREYGGIKTEKIKFLDSYNPDPAKVQGQIEMAKGIDKFSGQILYHTEEEGMYTRAVTDSVIEYVIADCEAKLFNLNNLVTNYLASHFVVTGKLQPADREKFLANLQRQQGARNASKLMHIEKENDAQTFEIKPTEIQKMDGLYQQTEISIKDGIRCVFIIPPVLLGDLVAGKMGTAQEIADATIFYNKITRDDRTMLSDLFKEILSHWATPVDTTNMTITELQ